MSKIAVWRHDGVINYCVPPSVAAYTFTVLAISHSSWLCFLLEDMASILTEGDLEPDVKDQFHISMEKLQKAMQKGHEVKKFKPRMNRGTVDYLDGWLYGTMHPTELAALADDLIPIAAAFAMSDQSEAGAKVLGAWALWVEAAKRYVRPSEQLSMYGSRAVRE
jgi:hypothetical protein